MTQFYLQNHSTPNSVAIIGASEKGLWTSGFLANIQSRNSRLINNVYLVNPHRNEVFGERCYASLSNVPEKVDQVVALINSSLLLSVVEDCVRLGIRSIIAVASGLEDGSDESQRLNKKLRQLCLVHGITLQGPNCFGYNNYDGALVSRYGVQHPATSGSIGIVVQSGQVGAAIADCAASRNIRLSYVVSSGNELVVDSNDYLNFFLDQGVRAIGCFLEQIPEPKRFLRIAGRAAEEHVPIVILAPGRTDAARVIAAAHTGAVAGGNKITDAFLRRATCIRVESPEELVETVGILAECGVPSGGRVFFCGFSGGAAELFAEESYGTNLKLVKPGIETVNNIAQATGLKTDAIHNPLDMTLDGARNFSQLVSVLADDPEIDILVAQNQPYRGGIPDTRKTIREPREEAFSNAIVGSGAYGLLHETGDCQPGIAAFGHETPQGVHYIYGMNGIRALHNAIGYSELLREREVSSCWDGLVEARGGVGLPTGLLSEVESKAILRAHGISTTLDLHVNSADDARRAFGQLGATAVMKIVSSDIVHKSDVGGVRLGVSSGSEAAQAYDSIISHVKNACPDARLEGALITEQLVPGFEAFVGITSDQRLGPAVVVGRGGVFIEVFEDVAVRMAPVSRSEAYAMLQELKCWPILLGTRGNKPLDVSALAELVSAVSRFASQYREQIKEVDLNPVFVYEEGKGAIAVDAVINTRD